MSYEAIIQETHDSILLSLYELLGAKPGDRLSWELKDNVVSFRKSESQDTDEDIPFACRPLTQEQIESRLIESVKSIEAGHTYSSEEVQRELRKLMSS